MLLQIVDVRAALGFVADLADCGDTDQLTLLLGVLVGLIGADVALITGCREPMAEFSLEAGDPAVYTPDLMGAAARNWREHPVMAADMRGGGEGARRVSDFVGTREWRRRELFNDFYRPLGARHELSAQLDWDPAGSSCCVALHRDGRDFGERELALLGLLAPHLSTARMRLAAGGAALPADPSAGRQTDRAARDASPAPAMVRAAAPSPPQALAARLPITPRESEVLARLAAGRTNDGIAADLGISRNTVARHVEHLYRKLGVHTRVAATRAALTALAD
jgi:DNA-binding CsgD family transcriptional regulator